MYSIFSKYTTKCQRPSSETAFGKMGRGNMQSVILLVDENLAWHHSLTATALWSDDFDVQLFAAVYIETEKING